MHAVLLTFVLVTGADQPVPTAAQESYVAPAGLSCGTGCEEGSCATGGGGCARRAFNAAWDWFGPMPQTCYAPRFGCYPGNNRHMHRYPAFHGYYYRQPYNYRHYFDYPWHAQPNEPMGYFTYQKSNPVDGAPTPAEVQPQAAPSPPVPPKISQDGWKPMSVSRRVAN